MELQLKGKVAVVAGGSRGIGASITRGLIMEGMSVAILARGEKDLRSLTGELGPATYGISADLTKSPEIERALAEVVKKFGHIDALVCNIGSGRSIEWGSETSEEWNRVLNLNLISSALLVRFATPLLEKTKGSIVCISSICGMNALGAPVAYSASKAALNHFVKESSRHLSQKQIRINAVAPGNIIFPGSTWDEKIKKNKIETLNYIEKEVPLKRMGTPEEIANLCAFLLSEVSSFTTGAIIPVDGGQIR